MEEIQVTPKTEWGFTKTRLKTNENEAFLKASIMMGTTRSRLLRKMIREFIREGPDMLSHDLDAVRGASYQLAALGRNLNQRRGVVAWRTLRLHEHSGGVERTTLTATANRCQHDDF